MARGLARSGFDLDLRDGMRSEAALEHVLRFGTYELKSDEICKRTGNIFVEFQQKGRPSGIAVTEAEAWAVEFCPDCYLVVPTRRMKALCRKIYKERGFVKGGDFNQYLGVLVPWSEMLKLWETWT